jgi:hypothetical protein
MSNETSSGAGKTPNTPMTPSDAARIQGAADRACNNQGFKGRAQAAGARNAAGGKGGGGGGGKGGGGGGKGR